MIILGLDISSSRIGYCLINENEDLLLVDLTGKDPEMEMDFTEENAQLLVENSSEFDNWLNEVVFDLENFRSEQQKPNPGKTETIPGS